MIKMGLPGGSGKTCHEDGMGTTLRFWMWWHFRAVSEKQRQDIPFQNAADTEKKTRFVTSPNSLGETQNDFRLQQHSVWAMAKRDPDVVNIAKLTKR